MIDALADRLPGTQLRFEWTSDWTADLDEALRTLPPMEALSSDTFRMLAMQATVLPKRHAVVLRGDVPMAVLSLRRRQQVWEPVTALAAPTSLLPARPGELPRALAHCGLVVSIPELFGDPAPYQAGTTVPFDVFAVDLQGDLEAHWRSNGYWKTIRSIRNRTTALTVRHDGPGDADWVLDQWLANWQDDPQQMGDAAADMRLAWQHMQLAGDVTTFVLLDGDEVVAGAVNLVREDEIIGLCTARVHDRPNWSLGTRLIDASMTAYRDAGYRRFDLGGWSDYKHRLAPLAGQRHWITMRPPAARLAADASRAARRCYRGAQRLVSRVTGDQTEV